MKKQRIEVKVVPNILRSGMPDVVSAYLLVNNKRIGEGVSEPVANETTLARQGLAVEEAKTSALRNLVIQLAESGLPTLYECVNAAGAVKLPAIGVAVVCRGTQYGEWAVMRRERCAVQGHDRLPYCWYETGTRPKLLLARWSGHEVDLWFDLPVLHELTTNDCHPS